MRKGQGGGFKVGTGVPAVCSGPPYTKVLRGWLGFGDTRWRGRAGHVVLRHLCPWFQLKNLPGGVRRSEKLQEAWSQSGTMPAAKGSTGRGNNPFSWGQRCLACFPPFSPKYAFSKALGSIFNLALPFTGIRISGLPQMSKRRPGATGEGTGTGTLKRTVATIIKWTQGILEFFGE